MFYDCDLLSTQRWPHRPPPTAPQGTRRMSLVQQDPTIEHAEHSPQDPLNARTPVRRRFPTPMDISPWASRSLLHPNWPNADTRVLGRLRAISRISSSTTQSAKFVVSEITVTAPGSRRRILARGRIPSKEAILENRERTPSSHRAAKEAKARVGEGNRIRAGPNSHETRNPPAHLTLLLGSPTYPQPE